MCTKGVHTNVKLSVYQYLWSTFGQHSTDILVASWQLTNFNWCIWVSRHLADYWLTVIKCWSSINQVLIGVLIEYQSRCGPRVSIADDISAHDLRYRNLGTYFLMEDATFLWYQGECWQNILPLFTKIEKYKWYCIHMKWSKKQMKRKPFASYRMLCFDLSDVQKCPAFSERASPWILWLES